VTLLDLDGLTAEVAAFAADGRVRAAAYMLLAAAVAVLVVVRIVLHRRDARLRRRGARLVLIAAPPAVDQEGAVRLWEHLAQIERSAWRTFWRGQPHLVFEYAFTGPRLTVRIWVPGGISVPLVRHAVAAAWPGSQTAVTDPAQEER
jgi:hypothetical protein